MIADLIIIGIIALCIFLGYARGLIKVAVKIIGFFAALIIALILYTPVSNYIINNTNIVTNLEQTIEKKIYNKEDENKEESKGLMQSIENYTNGVKEEGARYIAGNAAISIVRVGTWIALFLVARILMIFIKIFAHVIENIPIIKQFNRLRRNNIWSIRRICSSICITSSY